VPSVSPRQQSISILASTVVECSGLIRSFDDLVLKTQHNLFSARRMPWWTSMVHNYFIGIVGLSFFRLEIVLQSAREW
jgi:hypothetical protein